VGATADGGAVGEDNISLATNGNRVTNSLTFSPWRCRFIDYGICPKTKHS